MSYYHHGSIRKYTAALLGAFNDIEIQYKTSNDTTVSKNVPISYAIKEKSRILDTYTTEQLISGNYNVLPRSSLAMTSMNKIPERSTNKNIKINQYKTEDSIDFLYNSVPYDFSFELIYQCRGMNEVTQIVEQVCPKFNPTVDIDVWDATNLNEPTRVPVILSGVDIESEDYEEFSSNIFTVSFSLSLKGNLYPPIKSIERVKEFKMRISEYNEDVLDANRKTIFGWDVDENGNLNNEDRVDIENNSQYPPVINSIESETSSVGNNALRVIFEDEDNTIDELIFEWVVISGDATISHNKDTAVLIANSVGAVELQVTITDKYSNFASLNKVISIQ